MAWGSLTCCSALQGSFSEWATHSFIMSRTMGMRLTTPPQWFLTSWQLRQFAMSGGHLQGGKRGRLSPAPGTPVPRPRPRAGVSKAAPAAEPPWEVLELCAHQARLSVPDMVVERV